MKHFVDRNKRVLQTKSFIGSASRFSNLHAINRKTIAEDDSLRRRHPILQITWSVVTGKTELNECRAGQRCVQVDFTGLIRVYFDEWSIPRTQLLDG